MGNMEIVMFVVAVVIFIAGYKMGYFEGYWEGNGVREERKDLGMWKTEEKTKTHYK